MSNFTGLRTLKDGAFDTSYTEQSFTNNGGAQSTMGAMLASRALPKIPIAEVKGLKQLRHRIRDLTPAGKNGDIQFKLGNGFGSAPLATLDSAGELNCHKLGTSELKLSTDDRPVSIQGPKTSAGYSLTLPESQGGAQQVLENDGAGNLSWRKSGIEHVTTCQTSAEGLEAIAHPIPSDIECEGAAPVYSQGAIFEGKICAGAWGVSKQSNDKYSGNLMVTGTSLPIKNISLSLGVDAPTYNCAEQPMFGSAFISTFSLPNPADQDSLAFLIIPPCHASVGIQINLTELPDQSIIDKYVIDLDDPGTIPIWMSVIGLADITLGENKNKVTVADAWWTRRSELFYINTPSHLAMSVGEGGHLMHQFKYQTIWFSPIPEEDVGLLALSIEPYMDENNVEIFGGIQWKVGIPTDPYTSSPSQTSISTTSAVRYEITSTSLFQGTGPVHISDFIATHSLSIPLICLQSDDPATEPNVILLSAWAPTPMQEPWQEGKTVDFLWELSILGDFNWGNREIGAVTVVSPEAKIAIVGNEPAPGQTLEWDGVILPKEGNVVQKFHINAPFNFEYANWPLPPPGSLELELQDTQEIPFPSTYTGILTNRQSVAERVNGMSTFCPITGDRSVIELQWIKQGAGWILDIVLMLLTPESLPDVEDLLTYLAIAIDENDSKFYGAQTEITGASTHHFLGIPSGFSFSVSATSGVVFIDNVSGTCYLNPSIQLAQYPADGRNMLLRFDPTSRRIGYSDS